MCAGTSTKATMGTAESLLYYDEEGEEDVEGGAAEGGAGSSRPSASNQQDDIPAAPSHQSQRQQSGGNNQQSSPLTLRGCVIGSQATGKTSLVRRLRGEDPFAEDDVPAAAEQRERRQQRPQRKRKMMALVPWRDRQSGQHCQLHVVEKTTDDANPTAVAMVTLGDRPDFCICMVDPRNETSVDFAKVAIDVLLNAQLDERSSSSASRRTKNNTNSKNNSTALSRPNVCVLVNYMDSIKVVDDEEEKEGVSEKDDGLYRLSQSRLLDICADIMQLQSSGYIANGDARTTIPPSIQIYPSSMVSCSGLTSLHSFIMLPYMRKNEVRLLQQLELLHGSHNMSMADLREEGVKAMQQAIDEGKARMSTAPPISSGRRSIIQRQKLGGISNASDSGKPAHAGWEKRVRIDETRNTNHFEGDEPLPSKSLSSVQYDDIDEMTQTLHEADQARRHRRQQALRDGETTNKEMTKRSSGKQESSGSGRRSVISSKQRNPIQDTISKLPTSSKRKQPKKRNKNIPTDPMKALEDFLGSDSDSDVDVDPVHSGVGSVPEDGDSDSNSSSGGSNSSAEDDGGRRPSILLSDSDSEDDDFYYDEGGHAHYSHLDERKKPLAKDIDKDHHPSKRTESVEEVSSDANVNTPKRHDSKTMRSNHDEEEKKDESPGGRPAANEESSSGPLSPKKGKMIDCDKIGDDKSVEEQLGHHELLNSEDESSASAPIPGVGPIEDRVEGVTTEARPEVMHSDEEDSVKDKKDANSVRAVEILHSDDDDDDVKVLHSGDEESNKELESRGNESPGEVPVLDSEYDSAPSAADQSIKMLHSNDNEGGVDDSSSPATLPERPLVASDSIDERESSRVEILHSDEEEEDEKAQSKPPELLVPASIDSDEEDEREAKEPPASSSSSNVLVEALRPDETENDPEPEPEESKIAGVSAAVAAALAAAEEEAKRMVVEGVLPGGDESRRKKKKSKKDGKKSKKSSSKSANGEKVKKKKSRRSREE